MKKILCFIAAVLVSLVGCEDKSQDKSQKAETSLPSRPGKITVTAGTKTTDVSKEDKLEPLMSAESRLSNMPRRERK